MKKFINVADAKNLTSESEERKEQIMEIVNSAIEQQAKKGNRWSHFPAGLTDKETEWAGESLQLNGFTITESHPRIKW